MLADTHTHPLEMLSSPLSLPVAETTTETICGQQRKHLERDEKEVEEEEVVEEEEEEEEEGCWWVPLLPSFLLEPLSFLMELL